MNNDNGRFFDIHRSRWSYFVSGRNTQKIMYTSHDTPSLFRCLQIIITTIYFVKIWPEQIKFSKKKKKYHTLIISTILQNDQKKVIIRNPFAVCGLKNMAFFYHVKKKSIEEKNTSETKRSPCRWCVSLSTYINHILNSKTYALFVRRRRRMSVGNMTIFIRTSAFSTKSASQ